MRYKGARSGYRVTLTSIADAVICTDAEDQITFINPVAERLTGWPLSDATGHLIDDVFQIVDATTRKAIASSTIKEIEHNQTEKLTIGRILIRRSGDEISLKTPLRQFTIVVENFPDRSLSSAT